VARLFPFASLALLAAVGVVAPLGAAEPTCIDHPKRVGECRAVHGRLSYWNGTPTPRIWPVGTKRMLGVTSGWEGSLPAGLEAILSPDINLYGDFWVCSLFDPPEEGVMESVCVHTWRNLVEEQRDLRTGRVGTVRRLPSGTRPKWPEAQ
jgi:hypothetical protein